ncbi:carboxypeptidase-like regulatory domain-containing protein [Aeromicrobium ginsengisoli]|uniref:Carboxypeptidase regulatory-like domain-containing protein n=1 Tax=Aeromicrobium ginsengisoli TaxID=363867 RepID=A0A5M4FBS0_9ACTN|nr:carboxypeptidase-like regulatory domain-containing protein [Aeromicrobium ginsengisoli]KAA1395350.1 carboxypeptidase regulatory-like domain-containing protein [Aeromicrobium ginsengisoli]
MTARLARLTRTTVAAICAMVVLVAGGTTAAIATASAAPAGAVVTGTIFDPSGYPLTGITVRLFRDGPDEGTLVDTTRTNDAGRYRFNGVEGTTGDSYRVEGTDESGGHVFVDSTFDLTGTTTTRNATMRLAGFIQGKVSTKIGTAPAQRATKAFVSAESEDAAEGAHVSSKGTFRIGELPPGTYTLTFLDSAFAYQCYDNLRAPFHGSCSRSTKVTVIAGRTTTINPQVLDHPNSKVSGKVTDTSGAPLSGIQVAVYTDTNRQINDSTTKADGTWAVNSVDWVGRIKVVARTYSGQPYRTTWYKNAVDFAHGTAIAVKDGSTITGINMALPTK